MYNFYILYDEYHNFYLTLIHIFLYHFDFRPLIDYTLENTMELRKTRQTFHHIMLLM